MSELLDKARVIYESLPIADLKAAGIWPASDYELVFNYPPYQTLDLISPETIYPKTAPIKPRKIAVYLHFPFCQSICAYCHYLRKIKTSYWETRGYLGTLKLEVTLWSVRSHSDTFTDRSIQSLHVGGGTPSILYPPQLEDLKVFPQFWAKRPDLEMTIEGNPASLTPDWLQTAHDMQFDRLNIGVQSFEDHLLLACRRPHNRQQSIDAVKMAQFAGFENINIDLIFGLPSQTFEDWQNTLQTAIELNPASITCYKLRRKKATTFGKMDATDFPSPEDQLLMHIMAIEALTEAGYLPWHFETLFVRDPKYSHRHQEHKWQGSGELLGLGVSAYSFMNDFVYHNTSSLEEYCEEVVQDRLPIKVGVHLDENELMHRWMVLGLLRLRVDQEPFQARFGARPDEIFSAQLEPLVKLGLVEVTNNEIRIVRYPGLLFVMEILTKFFSPRVQGILLNKGINYGSFPVR